MFSRLPYLLRRRGRTWRSRRSASRWLCSTRPRRRWPRRSACRWRPTHERRSKVLNPEVYSIHCGRSVRFPLLFLLRRVLVEVVLLLLLRLLRLLLLLLLPLHLRSGWGAGACVTTARVVDTLQNVRIEDSNKRGDEYLKTDFGADTCTMQNHAGRCETRSAPASNVLYERGAPCSLSLSLPLLYQRM